MLGNRPQAAPTLRSAGLSMHTTFAAGSAWGWSFGGSAVTPLLEHGMAGDGSRRRSGTQHRVTQTSLDLAFVSAILAICVSRSTGLPRPERMSTTAKPVMRDRRNLPPGLSRSLNFVLQKSRWLSHRGPCL